ncbi:OmpH family outer membrane protein [Facilibium subflavum]|uniref:OmpH family outer membrane protein n=1 Tax=Facilibium subflavum TaxID=2219058 RepID=UPI000E657CEE|nr:OmpH family outer membrane protein [Facilibium subflavum]
MKKVITAAALSAALISGAIAAESKTTTLKIGIVNPIEVYQSVPQGEQSIKALQDKLQPKVTELQDKQQMLVKKMQKLQNDAPTLTQDDLNKQKEQLDNSQKSLQSQMQAFRQSEMQQEQAIAQTFQTSFNTAVKKVAKDGAYSLILSSQAVAYSDDKVNTDVTKPIIDAMSKDTQATDKKADKDSKNSKESSNKKHK